MIPVLSREQARAFDQTTIEQHRVPSLVLMENAGRGVVDSIERHWPERRLSEARAVVVSGAGNNGGDGFVIARHLLLRGATVEVFLTGNPERLKGDARTHYDAMLGVGLSATELSTGVAALATALVDATFVVDAIFGTGLSRDVEGDDALVLETIEKSERPIVAADIPSGLDADTGTTLGVALSAQLTVTFASHKLGLLTPGGAKHAGKLVVADIGVPGPRMASPHTARLLTRDDVTALIAARPPATFKNTAGHVVIFAGSKGHVGAAALCAHAAFRAGAGLVTIATWPDAADALEGRVLEVMITRLRPDDLDRSVDEAVGRANTVVMGPGFGKDERSRAVVRRVLSTWEGPSIVDADALAMFAGDPEVFASSKGAAVLTPHPGELGVLLAMSARDVEKDRFASLAQCVERSRSVTLLKGAYTLVGAPDERPVINASGNGALATAGAGDTLSGTIAALACTLDPFEAAFVGAHLHGLAAEAWSRTHGDRGLLAHEIGDQYPAVIAELLRHRKDS